MKTDKPIVILTNKKREETQFANVRNEGGDITIDSMDMQGKIKEYYEKLHGHTIDNLGKMEQFLERQELPKLIQRKIYNLTIYPCISDELPPAPPKTKQNKTAQGTDRFTGEFF